MASFKPRDAQREEFRKYLEKAGVLETLTKVMANLYEEPTRPPDALMYLKTRLDVANPQLAEVEALQTEVVDLKKQLNEAKGEIERLNTELAKHQCNGTPVEGEVEMAAEEVENAET